MFNQRALSLATRETLALIAPGPGRDKHGVDGVPAGLPEDMFAIMRAIYCR
jgi:hypothetical protein